MKEKERNKKKLSKVQVPNIIIDNNKVDTNTTMIYTFLKSKSYNNECNIKIKTIENALGIKRDTIIRRLKKLNELELLEYTLNRNNPVNIIFNKTNNFTWMYKATVDKIILEFKEIETVNNKTGEIMIKNYISQAIRFYYYLEKLYNVKFRCSFPKMRTIAKQCKISEETIIVLNRKFEKLKLLNIERGDYYTDDHDVVRKENNKYIPLWEGKRQNFSFAIK